jgi:hypothetical protein
VLQYRKHAHACTPGVASLHVLRPAGRMRAVLWQARACSTATGSVYSAGCSWPSLRTANVRMRRGCTHGQPRSTW